MAGKIFVLTGTLERYTRQHATELITSLGGHVTSSVSRKTDYVVVGTAPGSKYEQARKLGVTTLTEKEFESLVNA